LSYNYLADIEGGIYQ